jgi:hypothetical protein
MGNAVLVFVQCIGTAVVLAISNTIFQSSLGSEIPKQAPHADVAAIIAAGATHFRNLVHEGDLPGVLAAYAISIDRVFYLAAGVSGLGAFSSLGLGWVDIRDKSRTRAPGNNNDLELVDYDAEVGR